VPRPKVSAAQIEARRRQALQLLEKGYSLNKVSWMIGSAPSSVMRWRERLEAGGQDALKVRYSPGRPPSLGAAKRRELVERLLKGAVENGFSNDLWTTQRVAIVIQRFSRAQFHRSHVVRLMHELGFKFQESAHGPQSVAHPDSGSSSSSVGHGQKRLRGWVLVPHC
jgi:transposase